MQESFESFLLSVCKAKALSKIETIQSLWSGYGEIVRYKLHNGIYETVVVKHIVTDRSTKHPRGWDTSNSHNRKLKSYEVEAYWYQNWQKGETSLYRTAKHIGSYHAQDESWIVLEDLKNSYPVQKSQVGLTAIKPGLKWLANFHATHVNKAPDGLWEIGTYWHLDTRPDELQQMNDSDLKKRAGWIDTVLKKAKYQTIVHGDAKLANFCYSSDGTEVAAVDFQYVGGGCGMKDVSYFLGSCLNSDELRIHEKTLLNFYFSALKEAFNQLNKKESAEQIEKEWRYLYPFACADFTRFMLGWMPQHQKINTYSLDKVKAVLQLYPNG